MDDQQLIASQDKSPVPKAETPSYRSRECWRLYFHKPTPNLIDLPQSSSDNDQSTSQLGRGSQTASLVVSYELSQWGYGGPLSWAEILLFGQVPI